MFYFSVMLRSKHEPVGSYVRTEIIPLAEAEGKVIFFEDGKNAVVVKVEAGDFMASHAVQAVLAWGANLPLPGRVKEVNLWWES